MQFQIPWLFAVPMKSKLVFKLGLASQRSYCTHSCMCRSSFKLEHRKSRESELPLKGYNWPAMASEK